jgi:hypothetical protein
MKRWRIYLGFFTYSTALYQCTPALLSASWFPKELTMATGVAERNQLGIGFAFVFGTLLVGDSNGVSRYFGLLSLLSALSFIGTLLQFDDTPPTLPRHRTCHEEETSETFPVWTHIVNLSEDLLVLTCPPAPPNHVQGECSSLSQLVTQFVVRKIKKGTIPEQNPVERPLVAEEAPRKEAGSRGLRLHLTDSSCWPSPCAGRTECDVPAGCYQGRSRSFG